MAGEGPLDGTDNAEDGCGGDDTQGLDDCGEEGPDDEGCGDDDDQEDSQPCPELPGGATEGANPNDIQDCYSVAVEGDGVYCVEASEEDICGKSPEGNMCPRVGAKAESNCVEIMQSYNPTTKDCVLPEDAVCATLEDGISACVIPEQVGTQYSAYSPATKQTVATTSIVLLMAFYLF